MSAPAVRAKARQEPSKAAIQSTTTPKFDEIAQLVSLSEFLTFKLRCKAGCADLP
jgi:hypothetical protein